MPTLRFSVPGGNCASIWAWFTVGPLRSSGAVGRLPARGPGSALFSGYREMKESEYRPPENIGVRKVNDVRW